MAFTRYEKKRIGPERLAVIEQANAICDQYASQGMVLTLRQLYYQFVAKDKPTLIDRPHFLCGTLLGNKKYLSTRG